jgi:hypothetical protein
VQSSQQTVPVGTGRHRKEITMRTSLTTLTAVLMLTATSSFAQQAPSSPVPTEGPFSPFTYERLGATPSVRLPKWLARDEVKAANGNQKQNIGRTPHAAAPTAADTTAAAATKAVAPAATSTN